MKNIKNNKGFTLIELLAVIVILAILVVVAIPQITKYLDTARKGAFSDSVNTTIDAVRNDYVSSLATNTTGAKVYSVDPASGSTDENINDLLNKKLKSSPFGGTYAGTITVKDDNSGNGNITLSGCIKDGKRYIKIDTDTTNANGKATYTKDDVKACPDTTCSCG